MRDDATGESAGRLIPLDERALAGGTLLGLAMFVTLFLGVVLAVFLALGAAGVIVQLGPFGGANAVGAAIWPYAVAWAVGVTALAALAFRRRDL